MSKTSLSSLLLMFGLSVVSCGCGDQKAAPPTTNAPPPSIPVAKATEKSNPADMKAEAPEASKETALTPTNPDGDNPGKSAKPEKPPTGDKKPRPEMTAKPAAKSTKAARPFAEAALLPSDIVALVVTHPKQFLESPLGRLVNEADLGDAASGVKFLQKMKVKIEDIERATIVIDQAYLNKTAGQVGLDVGDGEKPVENPNQRKNSFKMIGLAFHNYHDVNIKFPRADGDGSGDHTGLSWRVHLLPYLDQAALYNQFHLDEAWDSEHNKELIAQMPAIFQSPDVTDEGKTSIHVFTGEKTPFHGEQGLGLRDFTDGTSNTILAIQGGADTAEIWTKPGGLEVDLSEPKKSIGEIKDEKILVLISDGSVRELPASIEDTTLANLIQVADGNVVDLGPAQPEEPPMSTPPMIFTLANEANQDDIVKALFVDSTEETHEGQKFSKNLTMGLWFPDGKTVVVGAIESVKQMISKKQSEKGEISPLIEQLQLGADLTVAIDLESQALLIQQLVQGNPFLGMVMNIKTLAAEISTNGAEGDSLIEINVTALDPQMAVGLSAMATVALNQGKMAALQIAQAPNPNGGNEELQKIAIKLVTSSAITVDGDKIQFRIPVPSGFDRVPELLKPALESARAAAKGMQDKNTLKQIGLAFHNAHDVYTKFPGAGRLNANSPVGLSWRVALLPFVDQAALYNQFKLDEPWDSEHNKKLIDPMPAIFKSPGVEDPLKTAFHVFTGPGSPFADDKTPGIADFTDGTSNTFLAVLAGPDTAEIWTKPGGLDFDPEDPIKALGNVIGETFLALFADGSVKAIDIKEDPANLRRMIQLSDGEPVN